MAYYNGYNSQDMEQQTQDYDGNQEEQYPDIAGCTISGTTYYGIQQNSPVYNNGGQTFQGLPQNRQMIVPVQIQGNNFYHQQMFNPYGIFQPQNYHVQPIQSYIPPYQATQQPPTFIPPHGITTIMPPHQGVQGITTIIPPHQGIQQTTTFIPTYQHVQEITTIIPPRDIAQQSNTYIPPHHVAVQQTTVFIPPHQDVQEATTCMPPHQDIQKTTTFIPPHQDVQETTSSNGDSVHQTQHYQYKPWYFSEFTHKKDDDDDDEVSDYHKPTTDIIVKKKGGAPSPEVLQEEQIIDEAAGETVSSPDAGTTLDYPENLWDLICRFCPAESSLSNLLCSHICDMSLVEDENKENITCNTCFARLPSGVSLEDHKKTRRHLLLLLNYKGDTRIDEISFFYCSLCRVQCRNHSTYTNHILSQKHAELQEYIPFDLYSCNSCKLTMDETAYEVHLSSKTHVINSMVGNSKLFCLTSKLDVSKFYCKVCKVKCINGKLYKEHQYSLEHCSNLLELKVKDDFSHSHQYVFFNNNKYLCVLCKVSIADKASLTYHFVTDEHASREESFEKMQYEKFISGEYYLTAHIREEYLKCSECNTFQRDCEHMFKNENEYQAWKEKIEEGKYCVYCNCFSDLSHESSEFHIKMISTIRYCQVCDRVLTTDLVKHEQTWSHRKTVKRLGPKGVKHKRGPSKLYCGICESTCYTENDHIRHLAGLYHITNYNTKRIENRFHCKLCNFTVTELYQYEEHEKSIDHVEKLNNKDRQFDRFKFCFVCRQPITNGTISEHIETVEHLDAIKTM